MICKVCGFHNEAGAEFCGQCGTFLEWSGEASAGSSDGGRPRPRTVGAAAGSSGGAVAANVRRDDEGLRATSMRPRPAQLRRQPRHVRPRLSPRCPRSSGPRVRSAASRCHGSGRSARTAEPTRERRTPALGWPSSNLLRPRCGACHRSGSGSARSSWWARSSSSLSPPS